MAGTASPGSPKAIVPCLGSKGVRDGYRRGQSREPRLRRCHTCCCGCRSRSGAWRVSGTRTTRLGGPPNGGSLPSYSQTNLGVSQRFELPGGGAFKLRFDVINLFDEIYLLRSSTSLGVFSPAFGPRRTFYAGIIKKF